MIDTAEKKFIAILNSARKYDASDVHLIAGIPPCYRVSGEIILSDWTPMERDEITELSKWIMSEEQYQILVKKRHYCLSRFHENIGRLRISIYFRLGVPELAIRMCNLEIKSEEDLMLPEEVKNFAQKTSGLIIITGPTGMGKTTTLNYLIDIINTTRRCKIVTIEDPVEFEHKNRKSIVVQLEVGTDTYSFSECLHHVLRMDPNVICIGEMRDLDTIETALTAAETGHLVLATLHTPSAYGTLDRIVSSFEGSRQPQVITQLASVLEGVIAQRLIPTVDKKKRVLATEILIANKAVRHQIRSNEMHKIRNVMITSRQEGMHTIEKSLINLYQRGLITLDNAFIYANEPDELNILRKR